MREPKKPPQTQPAKTENAKPNTPGAQPTQQTYTVTVTNPARRDLRRLHPDYRQEFDKIIEELKTTPRPGNAEQMHAAKGRDQYRIRVRDFRMVYVVEDDKVIVLILHISPRGEVYKVRRRAK